MVGSSADDDGHAVGERDGDPVRPRGTLGVAQGKVVFTQPRREAIRITAQLHPGDADCGAAVLGDLTVTSGNIHLTSSGGPITAVLNGTVTSGPGVTLNGVGGLLAREAFRAVENP